MAVDPVHAVDRYIAGELGGDELEKFEEHVFECTQCAEELRAWSIFKANAKKVLGDSSEREVAREPHEFRVPWWRFLIQHGATATAAAVLFLITAYQTFVTIPGYRARIASTESAVALASYTLHGTSRGNDSASSASPSDSNSFRIPSNARFYSLFMDWPVEASSDSVFVIEDDAGNARATIKPTKAGEPLTILLNVAQVPPGHYNLVVRDRSKQAADVARYSFKIEIDKTHSQ